MAKQREDVHTFASEPREIAARKKPKYREMAPAESAHPGNIMYDKRVVRGNTYAAQPLPQPVLQETRKPTTTRAQPTLRLRAPGTPQPVEGRRHMDVQTELYLEELTDAPQETEAEAQTDAFLDRPATPLYVPLKVGADVATQIEPGELFNFDVEVEPLLEVLVGKTMEQALQEVCEEEELAALAAHQAHFEALRNAELAAAQRMETAERRRTEEKERRLAQARERAAAEKRLREKIAAQTFARSYVSGLVGGVFDQLTQKGFFYDPLAREVEKDFLPWLTDGVVDELQKSAQAMAVVRLLVAEALGALEESRAEADGRRQREREEEAERQRAEAAAEEQKRVDAAACEAAAAAFFANDPPLVPPEKVEEAKEALGEGATLPAVLEKLVADGALTQEAVVEFVTAKQLAYPPFGVPVPKPAEPEPEAAATEGEAAPAAEESPAAAAE